MHRHHKSAYVAQFKHDDFQFGLEIVLGACQRGAADAGEVLVTAGRIKDGDADAWVRWFADAVSGMLEAPMRAAALGAAAADLVRTSFGWDRVADIFADQCARAGSERSITLTGRS